MDDMSMIHESSLDFGEPVVYLLTPTQFCRIGCGFWRSKEPRLEVVGIDFPILLHELLVMSCTPCNFIGFINLKVVMNNFFISFGNSEKLLMFI